MVEKLALSLVHAARRLRPYFQNHDITVKTDYPIQKILQKPDLAGRMSSWVVELSEFNIRYEPHDPIKGQCLLDFVNDLQHTPTEDQWTLHVDGSSNPKGAGAGIVLEGPNEILIEKSLHFTFKTSNNQAEYEAILVDLSLAREVGVKTLTCRTDSKLTVGHLNDEFQIKDRTLLQYYHLVHAVIQSAFDQVRIEHIPRTDNIRVDILSKLASTRLKSRHRSLLQQTLSIPSITNTCHNLTHNSVDKIAPSQTHNWTTPYIQYLQTGNPLQDVDKIWLAKAARYTMVGNDLYKRGYGQPLLKCVTVEQAQYIIKELHEGICGYHSSARTMATRILRAGYFWPTIEADCQDYIKKCKPCQKHGNLIHQKQEQLHSILSPWPFAKWGMDILGPFSPGKGQVKFLIIAVDYFTKWIEAKPLTTIIAQQVQQFVWKDIIFWYGVPYTNIIDNGRQFIDKELAKFYTCLGIKQKTSTVEHPQTNGQAEVANKVILMELRKRLDNAKGTPQSAINEFPFSLVYGADAMIPVEIGKPSLRWELYEPTHNHQNMATHLDLLPELREKAQICNLAAKQRVVTKYNANLYPRLFIKGDLVWRMANSTRKKDGKFSANWDGPYRIREDAGGGAYHLEHLSGEEIPNTWKVSHLKFYFS